MKNDKKGIDKQSKIEKSAQLGKDVFVGAFSYIGVNAKIGNNVKIYPNCFIGENVNISENSILYAGVKIYHDCKIGKNNILHSGVVIGGDGFGFSNGNNQQYTKIAQIGFVPSSSALTSKLIIATSSADTSALSNLPLLISKPIPVAATLNDPLPASAVLAI